MGLGALLLFFISLLVLQKGLTELVQTQQTVIAAVGEEVLLNCQPLQSKHVVQVTWCKILLKGIENLISCHREYGLKVNLAFKDKVKFTDVGLQNSSIVISNVTEEDEGCYLCLFTTDPGDDLEATTCLTVYELHEPVLHVGESGSEETVVSCWATGRPAPTVTLTVLRDNVHFPDSVSVNNTNGTVTVTSTAVLTRLHDVDTEVRCAVRVLSAPQREEVMMIPAEVKQSAEGFREDSGSEITWLTIIGVFFFGLFICCVAAGALTALSVWVIQRHLDRHSEEIKTRQETTEHKETLMRQDSEQLRKRSAEKSEGSDSPKASSGTQ